jgi:ATP-dependent protease HslVU (ClpYQ) peptidase subunit
VVWDGTYLAADRQVTRGGQRGQITKLLRLSNGEVLSWTGHLQNCLGMQHWYLAGAKPSEWGNYRVDTEAHAELIILSEEGLWTFSGPYGVRVEDPFVAIGSGAEYAMAALAMGATAEQAVEIASRFDNCCGLGVDVMRFERPKTAKKQATRKKTR